MNRNRTKGMLFLILVGLTCLCTSCGEKEEAWSSQIKDKPDIAVITKSTDSNFWKAVQRGVNTAASEYNLNVTFEGPTNEEDYQTQNKMIQEAVKDGIKAIVVSIIDTNASVEVIKEAKAAGVYVVIIDSGINMKNIDAEISTNNYDAGSKVAKAILKNREEKISVGIVNFDKNTTNGQEREKGFRDWMKKEKRAHILESINVESNIESAKQGTKELIKAHPEMNAIATFNEWTTLGVGSAIQELNLSDQIQVVAFDNNVISVAMLESGEIDGLIVQNPFAMGYLGIENAYHLIKKQQKTGNVVYTDAILVNKQNMFDPSVQKILFPLDNEEN